jgi:hypothetical protein
MAPYQNRKPFVSKMNAISNFDTALTHLHLQITNAGLGNVAQDVLHNFNKIFVRTNINFGNNGKAAFALKIGNASPENKVWACDNGSVIMAIWKNEPALSRSRAPTKTRSRSQEPSHGLRRLKMTCIPYWTLRFRHWFCTILSDGLNSARWNTSATFATSFFPMRMT